MGRSIGTDGGTVIQETSAQGYPAQEIYDRAMELNDEINVKERE